MSGQNCYKFWVDEYTINLGLSIDLVKYVDDLEEGNVGLKFLTREEGAEGFKNRVDLRFLQFGKGSFLQYDVFVLEISPQQNIGNSSEELRMRILTRHWNVPY